MRHWFLGDSCIVRYRDAHAGDQHRVRINGGWFDSDERTYICAELNHEGNQVRSEPFTQLSAALDCGEQWLP